jgi:hypothetical protein
MVDDMRFLIYKFDRPKTQTEDLERLLFAPIDTLLADVDTAAMVQRLSGPLDQAATTTPPREEGKDN